MAYSDAILQVLASFSGYGLSTLRSGFSARVTTLGCLRRSTLGSPPAPSLNRRRWESLHPKLWPAHRYRENLLTFSNVIYLQRSILCSACLAHWFYFFFMTRGAQSFA